MKKYFENITVKVLIMAYVLFTLLFVLYFVFEKSAVGILHQISLFIIFSFIIKNCLRIKETDSFTGMYKKSKLFKDLERRAKSGKKFKLCLVDFNGLKKINDKYGHLAGDKLILAFSSNLKKVFEKDKDIVLYRYTCGDEFCIVLYNNKDCRFNEFEEKIKKISALKVPINAADGKKVIINLTISYGFADYNEKNSIKQIVDIADKNMYEYKRNFKKR